MAFLASAACLTLAATPEPLLSFPDWKTLHGKSYASAAEELERTAHFAAQVEYVTMQNARYKRGESTWYAGLNQFSDLSDDEYTQRFRTPLPTAPKAGAPGLRPSSLKEVPKVPKLSAVDWRAKGAVTPIKSQGPCGGCWAFATAAIIEGINAIRGANLTAVGSASVQEVIDCCADKSYCNGCSWGALEYGLGFAHDNGGLDTYADYAFTAATGTCDANKTKKDVFTISGYERVPVNNESALAAAVANQPVGVDIDVGGGFRSYSGGVFDDPACGTTICHAVALVGYNATAPAPYYILKNSWATSWGDQGFMYIAMNKNGAPGTCGIAQEPSYPTK